MYRGAILVVSPICVRQHTPKIKEVWPTLLVDPLFRLAFRAQRANLENAGSEYQIIQRVSKSQN